MNFDGSTITTDNSENKYSHLVKSKQCTKSSLPLMMIFSSPIREIFANVSAPNSNKTSNWKVSKSNPTKPLLLLVKSIKLFFGSDDSFSGGLMTTGPLMYPRKVAILRVNSPEKVKQDMVPMEDAAMSMLRSCSTKGLQKIWSEASPIFDVQKTEKFVKLRQLMVPSTSQTTM